MEQAHRNATYSAQLLKHQASILDAAERGYSAGTQAYISALESFLLYESIVRNNENDRFERLIHRVRHYGSRNGWTRDLAVLVDAVFANDTP